jgi:hypothetical protein
MWKKYKKIRLQKKEKQLNKIKGQNKERKIISDGNRNNIVLQMRPLLEKEKQVEKESELDKRLRSLM